jgi:hypothetical protein
VSYDRALLLGAKRDAVLELAEVQRYGRDSFGDPDYVSLYGMPPREWYARGARIAGRTAVECTRDALAQLVARDVAAAATRTGSGSTPLVLDPFAGSANTLYWIVRSIPGAAGIGFELDPKVHALTCTNLALLPAPIEYHCVDYAVGLAAVDARPDQLIICFVAPPWGAALDPHRGLDLSVTTPPVAHVIDTVSGRFAHHRVLFAVQIYEHTVAESLDELRPRFDSMSRCDYRLTAAGTNHGIVLGASGSAG